MKIICSKLANYGGIKTIVEPLRCFTKSQKTNERPDIRLIQPSFNNQCRHDIVLDIAVVHPCTECIINKHNTDKCKGAAAKMRESSKRGDYKKLSEENDLHFTPIIFETHGRWGKDLIHFFDATVLAGWRKSGQHIPLSTIKEYWKKRISVALQLMNARMFLYRTHRISNKARFGSKHDESVFNDAIINSHVRREDCEGF